MITQHPPALGWACRWLATPPKILDPVALGWDLRLPRTPEWLKKKLVQKTSGLLHMHVHA
eukprot:2031658-Lingulodinium_polyedra.AAC.1